jgi:4-hydroxybenzoate polyprenyltransferase
MTAQAATLRDLGRFVAERFSPLVTVPLATALYGAPASLGHPGIARAVAGLAATFLLLLVLRMSDDLADRDRDRALHPGRGLISGRIDAARLSAARTGLAALLLALDLAWPARLALTLLAGGSCALHLALGRRRLPPLARPILSNLVFLFAVLHGAEPGAVRATLLLALAAWLTAVAHEVAHNVQPAESDRALGPGYAARLGARGAAALAAALFAAAAAAEGRLWLDLGRPALFGMGVAVSTAALAAGSARLVLCPTPRTARPLYLGGILFGSLPPLALAASRLLSGPR